MKTLQHTFFRLIPFLFFLPTLHAASVKVVPGDDGTQRVVMENNLVHLEIDPDHGARAADFEYKSWDGGKIIHEKEHGLFLDHFWQENWPGQFLNAKYDVKIVQQGPDEVSVTFSHLTADPSIPQLLGILLEKTITLKENQRKVDVTVRLTNTTSVGKYVGYWMQNVCWLGGDLHGDQYFRPSKRGISQDTSDDQTPVDGGFIRDPQAGWLGAIDAKTRDGLVFFMDYNYLWFFYNCTPANTIEWQDDAVALPAGKSWETAISVVPTSKLDSVSFASKHLLASVTFKEDTAKNQLEVAQTYVATDAALPSVEVQAEVETLLDHQKQTENGTHQLSNLGPDPQVVTLDLPYDTKKREPAVVRLTWKGTSASGEAFTEKTELWYPGSFISNTNPTDGSPLYAIPSAPREKVVIKPDKIARIVQPQPHVLFLQGLLAPSYNLEQAIHKVSPNAEIKNGYAYNGGSFGWGIDFFPYDYDALMSYDLVIISDVNVQSLGETGIEMLKDYCKAGGNLLVLAGPCAYGDGGYQQTPLQEILPVLSGAAFDLHAVEKGSAMKTTFPANLLSAKALAALRPAYLNQVKAKPDAQVLLSCGSWPMMTLGKYGDGKVCCVTAPPMGTPLFCDQPSWQPVLEYLLPELGLKR